MPLYLLHPWNILDLELRKSVLSIYIQLFSIVATLVCRSGTYNEGEIIQAKIISSIMRLYATTVSKEKAQNQLL